MSRRVDPKTVKAGDRVRVGRETDELGPIHGIKFGAVCTVVSASGARSGILLVEGPMHHGWSAQQTVDIAVCRVAK